MEVAAAKMLGVSKPQQVETWRSRAREDVSRRGQLVQGRRRRRGPKDVHPLRGESGRGDRSRIKTIDHDGAATRAELHISTERLQNRTTGGEKDPATYRGKTPTDAQHNALGPPNGGTTDTRSGVRGTAARPGKQRAHHSTQDHRKERARHRAKGYINGYETNRIGSLQAKGGAWLARRGPNPTL